MATDLVPVAWGAGEGLPGWVVLGKAGLVEGEDFCLTCVFLGHVCFSQSGEGDLASLAGLKPVPGQAGPLLPRLECSGELVGRWCFPAGVSSPSCALRVGQTFLCPPQE